MQARSRFFPIGKADSIFSSSSNPLQASETLLMPSTAQTCPAKALHHKTPIEQKRNKNKTKINYVSIIRSYVILVKRITN